MKKNNYSYNITVTALFTAIISVCSWFSLSVGTVPFTLQTMGVLCAGGLLGYKKGVTAVITYIILGAAGLPVFNGFSGGASVIFGSTGGYIIGFIFTAIISGIAADKFKRKPLPLAVGMCLGVLACYITGTLWFMAVYTANTGPIGLGAVLLACVVPFIIPDILKIAVSVLIVMRITRYVNI